MAVGAIDRSAGAERPATEREPLTVTTLAWLAAVPVAGVGIALGAALGPALGRAFFAVKPRWYTSLPSLATGPPSPEPTQHALYLIALAVPAVLALGLLQVRPERWRLSPRALTAMVLAAQLLGIAFAALNGHAQRDAWIHWNYPGRTYFPPWAPPAAVAFALIVWLAA